MRAPQLDGRAQGAHGIQRQVKTRGILREFLSPIQHRLQFLNPQAHHRGVARRVLHHPLYVLVTVQHKGIAEAIDALPRQHQYRRLPVQYRVGFVPVLLGTGGKQIHILEVYRAGHGAEVMVGGLVIHVAGSVSESPGE